MVNLIKKQDDDNYSIVDKFYLNVNPIKNGGKGGVGGGGGGVGVVLYCPSFSNVTSTNVGINPQNFLTFSFNLFAALVWNFKTIPSVIPKLLNLNQDYPSKKVVFLVNLSHVIRFSDDTRGRSYDIMTFISKYLYFKKA